MTHHANGVLKAIPCYWIEPAGRVTIHLRRYRRSADPGNQRCPSRYGYCTVYQLVGEAPSTNDEGCPNRVSREPDATYPRSDPRWPTHCPCGYEFVPADGWQVTTEDVYRDPLTGEEKDRDEWAYGAVYRASWFEDHWKGPDGISIVIRVPDANGRYRDWSPDSPSTSGTPWSRQGDPRVPGQLSCQPSILMQHGHRFHAFITNGVIDVLGDTEPW